MYHTFIMDISASARIRKTAVGDNQLGDLGELTVGERCSSPSGVWGGATAEIEFGAF